jgi:RND family efflux transporter MFP subunit
MVRPAGTALRYRIGRGEHVSNDETAAQKPVKRHRGLWIAAIVVLIGAGVIAFTGIKSRMDNFDRLNNQAAAVAIPTVEVIHPTRSMKEKTLALPGDVEAFYSAPIYARVNGYVKMWYKDIGARVKAGDILGEIDTPDLDQQLSQSRANLDVALANWKIANITARRWKSLLKSDSVSRQDSDVKDSDNEAQLAVVKAAQADVARLQALEAFKRLVAPFDGIVTARRTDVGALVNAGGGVGPEMFEVADVHQMRVYVRVPQSYTAQIKVGMQVEMTLPQYPDRVFAAKLITTAAAIDPQSRTMLVELLADNPEEVLTPGTYATVNFSLPPEADAVTIPVSAFLFQQNGMQVATLDSSNHVVIKDVTIGTDMGINLEVVAGLSADDRVINTPPDELSNGDFVHVFGEAPGKSGHPAGTQQVSQVGE